MWKVAVHDGLCLRDHAPRSGIGCAHKYLSGTGAMCLLRVRFKPALRLRDRFRGSNGRAGVHSKEFGVYEPFALGA